MTRRRRAWAVWLPLAGAALFVAAYFYAAARYPGGTALDAHTAGYRHLANYWCDLLDPVAYDGRANPGRPAALAATIALPVSLVPLWLALPALFGPAGALTHGLGRAVRVAGPLAMLAAALVFSPLHDLAINAGAAAGLVAGGAAGVGLARARRWALIAPRAVAAGFAVANYALWATRAAPAVTPAVQKGAYVGVLAWVVLAALALAGVPAPRAGPPGGSAPAA